MNGLGWKNLDPVFIRGMQRSGTTVLDKALKDVGLVGFAEGHLWFEIAVPLARFKDPDYITRVRGNSHALSQDRHLLFERYLATGIDQFHRNLLGTPNGRWVDKSPGYYPILTIPALLELFPESQVVFIYRNGMHTVHSGREKWGVDYPHIFKIMCIDWANTMSAWRRIRKLVSGRCFEVAQEYVTNQPSDAARELTAFLSITHANKTIEKRFREQRNNTSFPHMQPGNYAYSIDWTDTEKDMFIRICAEEMDAWGYSIDFEHQAGYSPRSPKPHREEIHDFSEYSKWLSSEHAKIVQFEYFEFSPEVGTYRDVP